MRGLGPRDCAGQPKALGGGLYYVTKKGELQAASILYCALHTHIHTCMCLCFIGPPPTNSHH